MITKLLSQKLVLLVIGLAAGSSILIPAGYASFHPVTSSEIQDGTIQSIDIGDGQVKAVDIGGGAVTNAKLTNGAVNSAKIADNSILASDIAANSVGGSEVIGTSKLIFAECSRTDATLYTSGTIVGYACSVIGTVGSDNAVVTLNDVSNCFSLHKANPSANIVNVDIRNVCPFSTSPGDFFASIIVYNTEFIRG